MTPQPQRGLLLVRPVQTDETLPNQSIVLLDAARERMTAWQCEVIAVGEPALCEDDECERPHEHYEQYIVSKTPSVTVGRVHACPVEIGAWLLVRPRSYIAGPEPERAEWYVHQDDVLAILSED